MRITGDGIWGDPPDREAARDVLRRAVDRGVTFIDTANSYGPHVSEELIGEALRPYAAELVIGTKGGLVRPGPNVWEANGRPEHLRHELEGSLSRLGIERIDLHQFHRPDPDVALAESIGALAELKAEGKIRHIGICNADEDQLREAMSITPIVSLQNRYNLDDRRSESLVDLCEDEGVAFLPWAPIQGYDGNKVLQGVIDRTGATARQVVLAWLLARSSQMLPIPGTGSVDHLDENIDAVTIELTPDEVAALTDDAA
jgi:aryl-alcohol dehydrogenase-like predicted oxidoreductase